VRGASREPVNRAVHERGGVLSGASQPGSGSRAAGTGGGRSMARAMERRRPAWRKAGNCTAAFDCALGGARPGALARRRVRDRTGIPAGRSPRRWREEPGRRPERRRTRTAGFSGRYSRELPGIQKAMALSCCRMGLRTSWERTDERQRTEGLPVFSLCELSQW
jgi:hypothetical protein